MKCHCRGFSATQRPFKREKKMKASLVLTLQGNVVQQARQFAEGFRALSTNGRTQMALLSRGVKSFSDGLDALGNKYTGMLTGAAGAAALRSAGGMESRLERLGIVADRSKKEMQKLNDEIFKVSQDRKINVDSSEVLSAIEQIAAKTGDMAVAEENLKNIAMVLSATGASGDDVGSLFSNIFEKFNIRDSQEMLETIDALANQGKMGAFELRDLATQGERIISAYAAMGRTGKEAAIEMGTMMQLGRKGTGSTEQAATAFEALVRNLTDNRIIKKLRSIGVTVKDSSGNFRAIPDIVQDIIVRTKGNTTKLGAIFDEFARRAVNPIAIAYQQALREGKSAKEAFEQLQNLMSVDTSGQSIIGDSKRMAQTFEASVNSLKDALRYFANTNLAEPIAKLAQAINGIDGAQVQKYLDMGLKAAKYLAIAWGANKLIRGGVSLFSAVKNLRAGNIAGALGAGASMGNPMPVYVVNMGAGGMLADAAGMAMGGGTGKVWQFLKGAGKWGKLAGRAGAGLGMAYGVYEAFTAEDKKGIGQGVGTVIGSALGLLGGPIGVAIGGTLGSWAGGWIGGMFDDAEAESKKKYQEYMANQTHITRNNIHFQIDKDGQPHLLRQDGDIEQTFFDVDVGYTRWNR